MKTLIMILFVTLNVFAATQYFFVLGGAMKGTEYFGLVTAIKAKYEPIGVKGIRFYHWFCDPRAKAITDVDYCAVPENLVCDLKSVPETDKVVLMGHSFGGDAAINAAMISGKKIDRLVLFDPVLNSFRITSSIIGIDHSTAYNNPSQFLGFTIPANVVESYDFYRVATQAPYSKKISNTTAKYVNINIPNCKDCGLASHHGDAVWNYNVIKSYILKEIK
jgi:hypothetical protein